MAQPLGFSPEALDDLEAIATFIARGSPALARALVARIFEEVDAKETAGSAPDREVVIYGYRLLYSVDAAAILAIVPAGTGSCTVLMAQEEGRPR